MGLTEVAALCLILVLAGMVQGLTGFGFGLLSVALLGLIWPDPKTATIIPIVPNLVICAYVTWAYRSHIRWRTVRLFLLASMAGVPLGVLVLKEVDVVAVYLGLGLLLLVSGIYGLLPIARHKQWHRIWTGIPLGLLSGGLGGAFNTGGPPAIAYFSNQSFNRFECVAALQLVFLTAGGVRLGSLTAAGMLPGWLLGLSSVGVAAAVVGVLLGLQVLHRVSDARIQFGVKMAQLVLAAVYFCRVGIAWTTA